MKAIRNILILAAFGIGLQCFAQSTELINSMKRQQKIAEKQIIDLWSANKRGKEMESILSEYVIREVRLRSISGTNDTGTLLSGLVKDTDVKYDSPQALAQALVLEHLRRKGIAKTPMYFVSGRYLIKNADIEVKE